MLHAVGEALYTLHFTLIWILKEVLKVLQIYVDLNISRKFKQPAP